MKSFAWPRRALCAGFYLVLVSQVAAQLHRLPNTTLTVPLYPPTVGYTTADAFPGLTFTNPICIVSPPGETNRLFILGKNGLISVITNLASPGGSTFMDLTGKVSSQSANSGTAGERGLLGMAFHPGFATNGFFYVLYMSDNTAQGGYYDNLSRFKISAGNPNQGDPNSEVNIYRQADRDPNHNGGDIHFGADGYLYISVGDEGAEHDGRNCAQIITNSLFSGLLRIDVDKRAGNLPPNPGPSALTISSNYLIPADNPFIGTTQFDGIAINPNLVRTEFYAVGLRNPWRWNFDFHTNQFGTNVLYCGDVGQDHYEEVDVIQKGDNLGWAYWEGTNIASGGTLPHTSYITTDGTNIRFPIVEYAHGSATNQGNCVIGGVVYRGSNMPQLDGDYIYADYVDGNIWSLVASNFTVGPTGLSGTAGPGYPIVQNSGLNITAFGTDPRNGDVLFCATKTTGYATDATIDKIIYHTTTNGAPLPPTLADTGAFTNLMSLTSPLDPLQPAPGIVPYTVNLPFWSDNAIKSRWFSVPNTNLTIAFNPNGNWSFPTGMVWIKHFNLELTNGDPGSEIRLETRILVKNPSGLYGMTYRWGGSQTNATLVPASGLDESFVINDGGNLRTQIWHYPSQNECQTCHTPAGGYGLGFRTGQLNGDLDYGSGPVNQIQALSAAGYFSEPVTNDVQSLVALVTATNTSASLEFRSRSFLMANCSQCHQPNGTAQAATWDARISTPTALAGLINGPLANNLGDPANYVIAPLSPAHSALLTRDATRGANSLEMPPLDSTLVDSQATNVLTEWILSMTNNFWIGAAPDPQTVVAGNSISYTVTFLAAGAFDSDVNLAVSGLPAGGTGTFDSAIVNREKTPATLTITTTAATPPGFYPITVTGTGGGQTNADTVTLVVTTNVPAAAGTLIWTPSGTDTNWSTSINWTNLTAGGHGPPGISNDVVIDNTGAGQTNFVDASMTLNSLWYRLLPASGGQVAQFTKLNAGQSLNILGTSLLTGSSFPTAGYSLLVGTNYSANGNGSSVSATIFGAGGALNINQPKGVIAVAEYNTSGNHPASASTRAILDLSGLDDFSAGTSQLLVGCMANGSSGTLYLAKTNFISVEGGSSASTAGIDVANNGSNAGDPSYLYLGLNNHLNVDVIRVGGQKGYWGLMAYNPGFIGQAPVTVVRGAGGGASRVGAWLIGDLIGTTGTANVTCPRGTNDFTGGAVDILAADMVLGKTGTGRESSLNMGTSSNRVSVGTLTFDAGSIDVNHLTNGWQLPGDVTDTGWGTVNVNGSGRLVVNGQLVLASGVPHSYVGGNFPGSGVVTNLYYGASFNATNAFAEGILNINGGTVAADDIVAGGGVSVVAINSGSLTVSNAAGSLAARIAGLNLTNATLHFVLNGNAIATTFAVSNLTLAGVNQFVVDSVENVTGPATFPLVSYTGSSPADGHLAKCALPDGFSANLVNNIAQKRIDLVIAPNSVVTPKITAASRAGSDLIVSGSNGFPSGRYSVLVSTNLAIPPNLWLPVLTNPFDMTGGFGFTNRMNPGSSQLFYMLRLQ